MQPAPEARRGLRGAQELSVSMSGCEGNATVSMLRTGEAPAVASRGRPPLLAGRSRKRSFELSPRKR